MLTLYLSPGSSSMAPHIALHEIEVDFESRWISFANRQQCAPEYLALNPEGKVPTLLVDGRPLTEVAAILYYLAKHFPEARLLPENDLEGEAQIISWMSFIASTIHPPPNRRRTVVLPSGRVPAAEVVRPLSVQSGDRMRGNGRDAPIPAIRASESESGTATDTRRSAQCNLVAPSTFALPSAQISRGPLRLPQCCFRFVESRRFSRLEGVGSAFRHHIPFQRIACFLSDLPSRHAGFHKRLKQ